MEVPEKLYIHESQYWGLMANRHDITKKGIEYTRTDAFIEKACSWLEEHMIGWNNDFVKDFRKYMEGE